MSNNYQDENVTQLTQLLPRDTLCKQSSSHNTRLKTSQQPNISKQKCLPVLRRVSYGAF